MASMCLHVNLCAYVYQMYEDQKVGRGWTRKWEEDGPGPKPSSRLVMLQGPRSHVSFVGRDFPVFAQNRSDQNSLHQRSQLDLMPVSAR